VVMRQRHPTCADERVAPSPINLGAQGLR
jgi:hypothetical protein